MPLTASTVRTLPRELVVRTDEAAEHAMRRVDESEIDAVRHHLLGDLTGTAVSPRRAR